MTLFEYLSIAYSLLFTLAAMRIVGGIPYAVVASKRYWSHLLLVAILLLFVVELFWNFWSFRDVAWTLSSFFLALTIPGLMYACAVVVIPDNPSTVASWRDYYFGIRTQIYSTLMIWAIAAAIVNTMILGQSWHHPSRFLQITYLLLYGLLATSDRPRVHVVVLSFIHVFNLVGSWLLATRPGWLAL